MIKRKGQIVPKYLVRSIEKKAQHLIKFGCDVEIIGMKITGISEGDVIVIPAVTHVLRKKRQRTFKGFTTHRLCVIKMSKS